MTDSLIILAGGASSRMKKSTSAKISNEMTEQANSRSKALILLNNRPMLDYLLFNAKQAGFKNIFVVIGEGGDLFKEYYGKRYADNEFNGLSISFATQHIPKNRLKPLGTADAVFQTLQQYPKLRSNQFVVCNCDNLYSIQAFKLLKDDTHPNAFINYDRDVLKYPQERIERFALTKTNKSNFLEDIIEKPSKDEVDLYKDKDGKLRVSMNIFKFDGSLFFTYLETCPIHSIRNEKELPSAIKMMVKQHPSSMIAIPLAEHVPDLTSKEDILIMNEYLAEHEINSVWRKNTQI